MNSQCNYDVVETNNIGDKAMSKSNSKEESVKIKEITLDNIIVDLMQ